MSRFSPVLVFGFLAGGFGAAGVLAQAANELAPTPLNPPSDVPAALASHPKVPANSVSTTTASTATDAAPDAATAPRAVSDTTAAMLSATMPAYTPPKPVVIAKAPEPDPDIDPRLADQPKNKVIRLPTRVVRERTAPVLTARMFQNSDDITALAFKRYPGLRLSPFASLNAPIARAMFQEDQRLDDFADLKGSALAISRGGDAAEGDYLKKQVNSTFMHDVWGSGDPSDLDPFNTTRH